jgi:hypothetical protein
LNVGQKECERIEPAQACTRNFPRHDTPPTCGSEVESALGADH